jgi:hypothetical protein
MFTLTKEQKGKKKSYRTPPQKIKICDKTGSLNTEAA